MKMKGNVYYIFSNLISAVSLNSADTLMWHNGVISETEIWVKLRGDKGGAFKMNFQIVNTNSPNSIHSTCVLVCFEAQDTKPNFHIALHRYKDEVTNLGMSQWK